MSLRFDYQLLDSGSGYKLERFGKKIIARPESVAIWQPQSPIENWRYDAYATLKAGGKVSWTSKGSSSWTIESGLFTMQLALSETKNIGIFPEQYANWQWLEATIRGKKEQPPSVLNLFGYTGAATLVAAASGAKVCHVDAAQSIVTVAKENQRLSGLEDASIRWIVDDCIKFVQREIKRGSRYDGIILDPPAFGRGKQGEIFKFESHVPYLLGLCRTLLKPDGFLLLNCYAMGYTPPVVYNLLASLFPDHSIESGELMVQEQGRGFYLPAGIYARLSA